MVLSGGINNRKGYFIQIHKNFGYTFQYCASDKSSKTSLLFKNLVKAHIFKKV